jgi:hypothetical protein
MAFEHLSDSTKHAVDAISVVTVLGTLAQILPSLAALFTIIWTGFRIFETRTVQGWLGKKVDNVQKD